MEAEPGQVPYVRVVLSASAAAVADALTLDIRAHAEARRSRSSASSPDDRRLALGEPREPGRLQLRGLEEALSSWWTRKLSDVSPSMVFPRLRVTALGLGCELAGRVRRATHHLVLWLLATGAVMATINTLDAAALAYRHGLGAAQWPVVALQPLLGGRPLPALHTVALTMDPADLPTRPCSPPAR